MVRPARLTPVLGRPHPFRTPMTPTAAIGPADQGVMQTLLTDLATPVITGLAGMLGVYAVEDILGRLRRSGRCPERWR
ncbi:hypothetical protein Aph02nite_29780 [Actinoplanes philippinensis]|uniref:Uncharacterized protein n=1 Tax=Actinoplanes philippinensis TaxID=35752 RepID=A0A1I2EHC6_9ACTN|nr:hypothetical protein Aph02nite_29780 [Actinoplanes philippinensis]SFE91660.1 hypothetical protein SAMN05421541_104429 [Actinoplanes philippinensis]